MFRNLHFDVGKADIVICHGDTGKAVGQNLDRGLSISQQNRMAIAIAAYFRTVAEGVQHMGRNFCRVLVGHTQE